MLRKADKNLFEKQGHDKLIVPVMLQAKFIIFELKK